MALSNNNQAAFWEAMKEKYEKRNENLRQQEICLRERLEQLKQLMEEQQTNDDCDCVPEKLEKPSLVQCLVQKGKELILGSCTCGDPKIGQEFLCACHIVDPKIPLNFDSNACSNQGVSSPEGCLNTECEFYNPQLANPSEDPSIFSLKTTDIYYMDKLAELVKTEKCMQNKITELENKERCYLSALQDVNELMKKKPKNDPLRKEFDRIVDCLEGENRKLKNELEDLRLELKHCFERVEGPLRRSLENQREKCADMEKKLKNFQEKMTNKEDNYLKEINEIKAKLCQACCTMVDLNKVNSRLKNDLVSLENKCLSLEDELVKQQLKEAENILKFKKVICRRSIPVDSFNRGDDSEQDLEHIARKLSETLKEVYPCVNKVPNELTETVKGIKQLTELVGEKEQRRKKRSGKGQSSVLPTTSQIESFCCCYNIDESSAASAVVIKRASTAPEVAVKDTVDEKKELEIEPEKTTGDNPVTTASKAVECEIEYERRSQQTPTIADRQPSKDVQDVALSVCSCDDKVLEKTAPPQEEIPKTTQDVALSVCSCDDKVSEKTAPPQEEIPKTTQDVALSVCSCDDVLSEKTAPPQEEIPKTMQDVALSVCSCGNEVSIKTGPTGEQTSKNIQDTTEYSCPAEKQARRKSGTAEYETQSNCACGDPESTTEAAEEVASKQVEDQIESICSCDDQESKKSGPSEEVIAVKDLETLCPAGVCDFQNKLKLKVDTTCDIIDMPPEDIHVVTTLAKTGSLEITTEGPPGVIETKVNYLPCGKIEIVTKLIDRNKLNSFLEGKLLPLPDQHPESTCNESKTCGGQCEIPTADCVQQENNDKKSNNGTKTTDQLSYSAPYGSVDIRNNFVLVGETRIDHLIQNEWKNSKFDNDAKEEYDGPNIISNFKRMHRNKEQIYSEEGPNKEFKLASRPSLTDIEKYSHENVAISGDSLNSFVHPDALETISECDEDEHSTRNELKQNSEDTFEKEEIFERIDACCNTCQDISGDFNIKDEDLNDACCNTSKVTIGDFSMRDEDLSEASCNTSEEAILDLNMKDEVFPDHRETKDECESTHHERGEPEQMEEENIVSETKLSVIADDHSSSHMLSNSINDNENSETEVSTSISTENTNPLDKTLVPCSSQKQNLCGNGDICTCIHSEEQSSCSFSHLYRNLGNVNMLRGNFRLRQSRSLYENKRRGTECLRVCKSAVINLGSLKIDIEMIKFLPGNPKVGDFDDNATEEKEKRDAKDSLGPVLEIEHSKEPDMPERDEISPPECKIGFNSPDGSEIIPEKIYQCYVCNFRKKQEKQYESEAIRPPAVENLEERIDRLLQINPFAPSQDTDHQCAECSEPNIETNSPSNISPVDGRKHTKNSREKSNNVHQEQHRCKCTLKSQETSLGNELELGKQGDTLYHDENCTCVDCLCNPSKFKISNSNFQGELKDCKCDTYFDIAKNPLNDLSMFQFEKPPEITVMNVITPCDCGNTCTCNPCFDPNRAASNVQPQVAENKCVNNVPKVRQSLTKEPSLDDPFNNRDTWKNVVGCYCPPSSSKKKEVCDCKECECKPCGYKDKVRKPCDCKKPKEQPKPQEPPKKKGKCSSISCASNKQVISVIGDTVSENRASLSTIKNPALKKTCECEICECVFCSESETQNLPERIKEECSVYEKPCEKKYVSLLTIEPCDRSKCECGKKRLSRVENINYSNPPEKVEEVIVEKEEISTESGDAIPETEEVVLEEAPTAEETPMELESEPDEKQEDEKLEERPDTLEQCNCTECLCDPCGTTEETPEPEDHEDEQNVEDVPPEAFDIKLVTPLASEMTKVPAEEEKPASVIDQAQGDKTDQPTCYCNPPKAEEEVELKTPCDCSKPCPCAPCVDPNVINESHPPIIGDADIAKSEIRSVLEKISCTCNKAENDLKPLLKKASTFESTVSKMKLKLNNLEQKCKDKDQIINAMTKDLRMRSQSGVFANLLDDLAHPKERFVPDFNRTYVCDFLPKPRPPPGTKLQPKRSSTSRGDNRLEPILELDRYLPGGNEDVGRYRRNLDASGLEILDIRRVTLDSVLIKWRSPCNLSGITGYQIFVNDELKYKVLSPNRTSAVLDTLELSRSIEIMLFAMSTSGRCEPPALATYKI